MRSVVGVLQSEPWHDLQIRKFIHVFTYIYIYIYIYTHIYCNSALDTLHLVYKHTFMLHRELIVFPSQRQSHKNSSKNAKIHNTVVMINKFNNIVDEEEEIFIDSNCTVTLMLCRSQCNLEHIVSFIFALSPQGRWWNSDCCRGHKTLVFPELNHLKPTGHVMHHQFSIQQLYALPTLYLCVLYLSENKKRLVPLTA